MDLSCPSPPLHINIQSVRWQRDVELLDVIKYHGLYRTIRVRVLSLNRVLPVWDSPTPCHGLKANSPDLLPSGRGDRVVSV